MKKDSSPKKVSGMSKTKNVLLLLFTIALCFTMSMTYAQGDFRGEPLVPICGSANSNACDNANVSVMEAMVDGDFNTSGGLGGDPVFTYEFKLLNGIQTINQIDMTNGFPDEEDNPCHWMGEGSIEVWDASNNSWFNVADIDNPNPDKHKTYFFPDFTTDKIRLIITQVGGNQDSGCHVEIIEIQAGFGLPGGGFSFDFGATGGYAETDFQDLDGGSQITMEMFIQLHNPFGPGKVEFIQREMWGQLSYDGGAGGTFMFTLIDIGHIELTWPFSQDDGEWHHIAGDYDGVNMNIYWDGELKHTIPASGNLPSNTWPLRFGVDFDGLADIIRISDIARYKGNNFDPWTQDYDPSNMINAHILYHCNEGSGNQLIDDSGEEHHATITGNPTWDPDEPLGPAGLSLWIDASGDDFIDLGWDRWPDADQDFVRYELHRNNFGGVTLSDPVVLNEPNVNVVSWSDNNVNVWEGETYYYKLWMYDQDGSRYETNETGLGGIAGHVSLDEEWAPGQVYLFLWFPGHNPDSDPPDLSRQSGEDPPFDIAYSFVHQGIFEGGPYNIRAYFDADNNGQFDDGEPRGVAYNLSVLGSNWLDVDIFLSSQAGGHVEGNISSNEAGFGRLFIGLFEPGNSGEEWDPNFQIDFADITFPGDFFYEFNDPGIYDASGWNVRAFLDENGNNSPDGNEMQGQSGLFQISGGNASGIDIDLPRPSGGPQIGVSTMQLNFAENIETLQFQVGNAGQDTLYWEIWVEYTSGTQDWITSVDPDSGYSTRANEDYVTVTIEPTGTGETANIHIEGHSDPDRTQWIDGLVMEVFLDAWIVLAPPQITGNVGGTTVNENTDVVVNIQITAEAGVKEAALYYIVGGDESPNKSTFQNVGGDNYEAVIPAKDVTDRGLVGFIRVEDNADPSQVVTSDTSEIRVKFGQISILSTNAEKYVMLSVPGDLDNKNQMSVLDELGEYDKTKWRLFRWNGSDYTEFEGSAQFKAGNAFWIITKNAEDLETGSGTSTQLIPPYTINLNQGWNQIGTPYYFENGINDLLYTIGSIELPFIEYDGSSYRTADMMQPRQGYWLYANEATSIRVDPHSLGLAKVMAEGVPSRLYWSGRVTASVGHVRDSENIFGVVSTASEFWDEFDRHEPPVIGDYITLAFDNRDWDFRGGLYGRDIRSADSEGHQWLFVVRANQEGIVHLDFDWTETFPPGWDVYLVDKALRIVHDIDENPQYSFASSGREAPKHFVLVAGPTWFVDEAIEEYDVVPEKYSLAQNIPNPFNAVTTLRFSLPEESEVDLTIYDVLGREVMSLLSGERYKSGMHFALWDGKDRFGREVATGVYLYHLTATRGGIVKYQHARKLVLLK